MKTTFWEINSETKKYILPYFKVDTDKKGVAEQKRYKALQYLNNEPTGLCIFQTDDIQEGHWRCQELKEEPSGVDYRLLSNPDCKQLKIEFLTNNNAGIVHEGLLAVMIKDLESRNELVNSIETGQVIIKLQECLQLLRQREKDRSDRNVLGSNKE